MTRAAWLLLIALSLIWGGSFFFADVALEALPPLAVLAGRVMPAAAALLLLIGLRGRRLPRDGRTWCRLAVMGALNNILPFTLILWGQARIDGGLAAILNATTPLFAVLLAHVVGQERLQARSLLGVALGILGVAVLMGPESFYAGEGWFWRQAAVLGAAACYATAGLYGRRLRELPSDVAAAGMLTASAAMSLPLLLWNGVPNVQLDVGVIGAVLGLSLLSTAAAYLIYFRLLATAGPVNLLLVTFLIPPGAIALGAAFLGQAPEWAALAGMALIFAGLWAVGRRPRSRGPKPAQPLRSRWTHQARSLSE